MNTILNYETWIEQNNDNLYILAAESGADREYDFDGNKFCEEQYEDYLRSECFHCNFDGTDICYNCPAYGAVVNTNILIEVPAEALTGDDSDILF